MTILSYCSLFTGPFSDSGSELEGLAKEMVNFVQLDWLICVRAQVLVFLDWPVLNHGVSNGAAGRASPMCGALRTSCACNVSLRAHCELQAAAGALLLPSRSVQRR